MHYITITCNAKIGALHITCITWENVMHYKLALPHVLKCHTVRPVLKYHTVGPVLKYHTVRPVLKYHTVGPVLKSIEK
jgi:hypothetical protein